MLGKSCLRWMANVCIVSVWSKQHNITQRRIVTTTILFKWHIIQVYYMCVLVCLYSMLCVCVLYIFWWSFSLFFFFYRSRQFEITFGFGIVSCFYCVTFLVHDIHVFSFFVFHFKWYVNKFWKYNTMKIRRMEATIQQRFFFFLHLV